MWLKRSHRPHTHVVLSSLCRDCHTGSAPGDGQRTRATRKQYLRAVHQENGAPPVRGTATIYVNGLAGPPNEDRPVFPWQAL